MGLGDRISNGSTNNDAVEQGNVIKYGVGFGLMILSTVLNHGSYGLK